MDGKSPRPLNTGDAEQAGAVSLLECVSSGVGAGAGADAGGGVGADAGGGVGVGAGADAGGGVGAGAGAGGGVVAAADAGSGSGSGVSAGAGVDSSGCVGDGADIGGGVVTKTFVATGLTFVRDSLSTVCAPDVAFGVVYKHWPRRPLQDSKALRSPCGLRTITLRPTLKQVGLSYTYRQIWVLI